jgi:hypothetical protein
MSASALPIVVLAGSDRRPPELPADGKQAHPLSGYKGADVRIGGRTLVETVVERLHQSGRFGRIYVLGPLRIYRTLSRRCTLVDGDGTFGENIRAGIDRVSPGASGAPIAFTTCDILPEVDTLRSVMDEYVARAPCDLWFPLIRAPEDRASLGASAWKPRYRVAPAEGEASIGVLPGHLTVADPSALRLKFLYRLMQMGYRTRNRSINYRRSAMVRGAVLELLYQDLLHLATLRAPTLTWSVLRVGIRAARQLRDGRITRRRLEDALRRILVTSRHRRRHPERRVRLPIVDGLSLALDIDTEEEARAVGGDVTVRSA